jgi:hypothetical protein
MKRLTLLSVSVLLAGCSFTPTSQMVPATAVAHIKPVKAADQLNQLKQQQVQLRESKRLWDVRVPAMLKKLKHYVGKTRYVFSGSTPSGWDCSGLVMWGYKQLGYDIKHSATAQGHLGHFTKHPLPGDIVVWGNNGHFIHSAIYYSDGVAIHVGRPGERTSFFEINSKGFHGYPVKFVRVLPNPIHPLN